MIIKISYNISMKKRLPVIIIAILGLIAIVVIAIFGAVSGARQSLKKTADSDAPVLDAELTEEDQESDVEQDKEQKQVWKDGWVKYQGEIYQYKEDIITLLVIGTDQYKTNKASGEYSGGQADLLILMVLDPTTQRIEIIPINRNTITDIDFYDNDGNLTGTVKGQIAVQHGVGDGKEKSCEYQVKAVSRLMYQLPIHGYISMRRDGVIPLADAIGGVDVVVPEDAVTPSFSYKKGQELHLTGKKAMNFVWDRDHELGGADRRLDRQKVFMKALFSQLLPAIKANPTIITTIYNDVSGYITTDISLNEMLYLGSTCAKYTYDASSFHSILGETKEGEVSDEFYPDTDKLKELMIDVFYEKVDLSKEG